MFVLQRASHRESWEILNINNKVKKGQGEKQGFRFDISARGGHESKRAH